MKIAPIAAELAGRGDRFRHTLVHTGQHYDHAMSQVFLEDLDLGAPDYALAVGSGSHAQQIARVMERLEPVLLRERPDVVLVPGDVNSTLAAALTTARLGIPLGHVEAGLRSFDRTMPEEINRLLTDRVSDLLFTHSPEARDHLRREGIADSAIHEVGNTMIDTLMAMSARIESADLATAPSASPGVSRGHVVIAPHSGRTLARRRELAAGRIPAPSGPSARAPGDQGRNPTCCAGASPGGTPGLRPIPLPDVRCRRGPHAAGGIQEEATYLGIPCFTLHDADRAAGNRAGRNNRLLGLAPERVRRGPDVASGFDRPRAPDPSMGRRASERITDVLGQRRRSRGSAPTGSRRVEPRTAHVTRGRSRAASRAGRSRLLQGGGAHRRKRRDRCCSPLGGQDRQAAQHRLTEADHRCDPPGSSGGTGADVVGDRARE